MTLLLLIMDERTIRFCHEPVEAGLLAERINSGQSALDPGLIPGCRWKAISENGVVVAFGAASHSLRTGPFLELSPREHDVLAGAAAGLTYKQIAANLGLHPQTIAGYARSARMRLRAATCQEAVIRAKDLGLLGP